LALMQYLHLPVNGRVDFLSQASASLFYAVSMFYCYPRVKWPRRVVATADFSYSLYVMHWPLLMMALSLTQSWTGYSTIRAIVICIGACICIPIIVASIASVLERPHQFKKWLLRYVDHHRAGRLVCAIIAIGIGGVYFYPIILRHL
jgi:peptidoglycan/LPS O-acetylase OafA/YrhL